jgi:hypothetical protein
MVFIFFLVFLFSEFERGEADEQQAALSLKEMNLARFNAAENGSRRRLRKLSGFTRRDHIRLRRAPVAPDDALTMQANRPPLALFNHDFNFGFRSHHHVKIRPSQKSVLRRLRAWRQSVLKIFNSPRIFSESSELQ